MMTWLSRYEKTAGNMLSFVAPFVLAVFTAAVTANCITTWIACATGTGEEGTPLLAAWIERWGCTRAVLTYGGTTIVGAFIVYCFAIQRAAGRAAVWLRLLFLAILISQVSRSAPYALGNIDVIMTGLNLPH